MQQATPQGANRSATVRPSITALIDILGFSEHLALAKYDLRSAIGLEAMRRLQFIEQALSAIEREAESDSTHMPKDVRWTRLSDSLLLQVDLPEEFTPETGTMGLRHFAREIVLKRAQQQGIDDGDMKRIHEEVLTPIGREAAKFVGLAVRTHNYLNSLEWEHHFPGCRTVIACGLRVPFTDRDGKDDFLAANFSLTNAYYVQERGTSVGFRGTSIWLDDSIAVPISLDPVAQNLLYFSQFVQTQAPLGPYRPANIIDLQMRFPAPPERISVEIQRQEFRFTRLDPSAASNFQLVGEVDALRSAEGVDRCALHRYSKVLTGRMPAQDQIMATEFPACEFPFYFFRLGLDVPISESLRCLSRPTGDSIANDGDA